MADYSFENLSPAEFEILCRDVLQEELGVTLDSFMAGRDQGIDLRYSRDPDKALIVQCKRYTTTFSQLMGELKDEAVKVAKLKPKRYIIATSLPMNPLRKQKILALFRPYLKSADDIYGRENINNLLGKFPKIERQHYKLWFSSVNILQKILHADIVNKTQFEEQEIKKTVKVFSENDSFPRALRVFKKKGFVIISGAPGVGKTTLARMLIFKMMASQKYEQFVFISRDINEAYDMFEEEKPQLFFFDDFLGRSYFDHDFEKNEESDLLRFINKVAESKNKALILTTREYILQQAQAQYADLKASDLTQHKYVIDLGTYTKKIKAGILYNHLFASGLPRGHLLAFLDARSYLDIIGHPKYNPRLIESILAEQPWKGVSAKKFPAKLLSYFDDPEKIWKDVFESGISKDAQLLLRILLTLDPPLSLEAVQKAFEKNCEGEGSRFDYYVFEHALKEAEGTFTRTYLDNSKKRLMIDYQNPGIFDFLLTYYAGTRRRALAPVIRNTVFIDQLFNRFTGSIINAVGRIQLNDELSTAIANRVLQGFQQLPWSREGMQYYRISEPNLTQIMITFIRTYSLGKNAEVREYIKDAFIENNMHGDHEDIETFSQLDLLQYFAGELTSDDISLAISRAAESITIYEDIDQFLAIGDNEVLGPHLEQWLEGNTIRDIVTGLVEDEIQNLDADTIYSYEETLSDLAARYEFDDKYAWDLYEDALQEHQQPPEYGEVDLDDQYIPRSSDSYRPVQPAYSEDDEIKGMFESLR